MSNEPHWLHFSPPAYALRTLCGVASLLLTDDTTKVDCPDCHKLLTMKGFKPKGHQMTTDEYQLLLDQFADLKAEMVRYRELLLAREAQKVVGLTMRRKDYKVIDPKDATTWHNCGSYFEIIAHTHSETHFAVYASTNHNDAKEMLAKLAVIAGVRPDIDKVYTEGEEA